MADTAPTTKSSKSNGANTVKQTGSGTETTFKSSTDIGAVRRPVSGNLKSYKGSDGVVHKLAELEAAGLKTSEVRVTTSLGPDDARDLPALHAGIDRLYGEFQAQRKAVAPDSVIMLATKSGKTIAMGDPLFDAEAPKDGADPICNAFVKWLRSGQAIDASQTFSKPMRESAKEVFGSPKGGASSDATDGADL